MAQIFDGKKLAEDIIEDLKEKRSSLGKIKLGVVMVGNNKASESFVEEKKKFAQRLGVKFKLYNYNSDVSNSALRKKISQIKKDYKPDGLMVQLPLSQHLNTQYILDSIPKDIDCDVLSSAALGKYYTKGSLRPPVVSAIMRLVDKAGLELDESKVVVIGEGRLVGKPFAVELMLRKVSFTICDRDTKKLGAITSGADIIVAGTGVEGLIDNKDELKKGVCLIDCGGARAEVDINKVQDRAAYISPVPGGVGPLTVAYLFKNLISLVEGKVNVG